jgi:hypothetical protein
MDAIGGYFGLELRNGPHFHAGAIRLNTARNCLEYLLRARGLTKVYFPRYLCDVMLQPMDRLGIDYEFYPVDDNLDAVFEAKLGEREAFIYINYFGLKGESVASLAKRLGKNLIVDNAQAFFAQPIRGVDTFYSARKFFGVPDGAYLYTDQLLAHGLQRDSSRERMTHLLARAESSAEEGYKSYQENELVLADAPLRTMSPLTDALLASIDYESTQRARVRNYQYLEAHLSEKNLMRLPLGDSVPMVYPFRTTDPDLRERLISNRVFVATYWPNVSGENEDTGFERSLAEQIIPLPIDQRYTEEDLSRIVRICSEG